jgi:hypothetical protein
LAPFSLCLLLFFLIRVICFGRLFVFEGEGGDWSSREVLSLIGFCFFWI